jgi:HSP20 family protein
MLSRYDVYRPLLPAWGVPTGSGPQLSQLVNRLFSELETAFDQPASRAAPRQQPSNTPRVQLRDGGEAIAMLADLPGYQLSDIELSIQDTQVTLKAARKLAPGVPEGFKPLRRERAQAGVEWSFELPYAIDADAATASLVQGRLEVLLPKAPEAKPRTITVRTG